MKKTTIAMLMVASALAGCDLTSAVTPIQGGTQPVITMTPTQTELLHHHWVLEKMNGEVITMIDGSRTPTLEIGENFSIQGHTGCNEYHGQGELVENQFRVNNLAGTEKGCPPVAASLETVMNQVLSSWSEIGMTDSKRLVLKNSDHILDFALQDLVN